MSLLKLTALSVLLYHKYATAYVNTSELFSFGNKNFNFGDDNHVRVNLNQNFGFLNNRYRTVYIRGDGFITFGQEPKSGYTCKRNQTTTPTVAVYMSDADNREDPTGARVFYREDTSRSAMIKISKDVFSAFPHLEEKISLCWMLIVTWHNVPPYSGRAALRFRNTYQAILTADENGAHSFILFYYNNITWPELTRRNAAARVGIYGGSNTKPFYLVPGSCTYSLLNIGALSNFGQPGKLAFKVDSGITLPSVSKCIRSNETRMLDIAFKPNSISTLRKQSLMVHNLNVCLDTAVNSTVCIFHESVRKQGTQELEGLFLVGQSMVMCPSPNFYHSLGKIKVVVRMNFVDGNTIFATGYVYVVKTENKDDLNFDASHDTIRPAINFAAEWDPKAFQSNVLSQYTYSASNTSNTAILTLMELVGSSWKKMCSFEDVDNNGMWVDDSLSYDLQNDLISTRLETSPRVLTISSNVEMINGMNVTAASAQHTHIIHTTLALAKLKIDATSNSPNIFDRKCRQWHDHEPQPPTDVTPCPPTLQQATVDWRFSLDTSYSILMNPNNYTIYLQRAPSLSGAGSQCSYDNEGGLVIGFPYGSRIHRYSPNSWNHHWDHYWDDIIPYLQCCELSYRKEENCKKYYFPKRPTRYGYIPFAPFKASGSLQITSFDGTNYLLNKIGAFYLLRYGNQLELQALAEKYSGSNTTHNSSVITTAVVSLVTGNNISSKFQVTANVSNGLLIWLNDQPLNFYQDNLFNISHNYLEESFILYHEGVNVLINGTLEALFSFSNGFSLKFMLAGDSQSINIVGTAIPACTRNSTGLLGNRHGNMEYGERWRVPKTLSLLQFPPGKTYESYNAGPTKPLHRLSRYEILRTAPADIKTVCGEVEDCQIDYVLTDNEKFAMSSIAVYEEYMKLLSASKMQFEPLNCTSPIAIANGKFSGDEFKIGTSIEPICDHGFYLHVTYRRNKTVLKDRFICAHGNHISNLTGTSWVSEVLHQPLSDFSIECIPMDMTVSEYLQGIKSNANNIKHTALIFVSIFTIMFYNLI